VVFSLSARFRPGFEEIQGIYGELFKFSPVSKPVSNTRFINFEKEKRKINNLRTPTFCPKIGVHYVSIFGQLNLNSIHP